MNRNKITSIILILTAVIGLWLSYKTYQKMEGKKCSCQEGKEATPIV